MALRLLFVRFALCLILVSFLIGSVAGLPPATHAQDSFPVLPTDATATGSISGSIRANGAGLAGVTVSATVMQVTGKPQLILLPGVLGTNLKNSAANDSTCKPTGIVWIQARNIVDNFRLTPLLLDSGGENAQNRACKISPEGPVIVGVWGWSANPYGPFLNSAAESYDVLPYKGYDWRLDLESQAVELDKWIQENANFSRPIYLVGHSMGGLVARAYVAEKSRADKIAGVVTVGTPYLGAPVYYERAVGGRTGTDVDDRLNRDDVRTLIRNSPGILALAPSARWFSKPLQKGPTYLVYDGKELNYDETHTFLREYNLASRAPLAMADGFHDKLDGFDRPFYADGKYTVLYSAANTQTPFQYKIGCNKADGGCKTIFIVKGPGDGTVPVESASLSLLPPSAREGVAYCSYGRGVEDHADLLRDSSVIEDILEALGTQTVKDFNCSYSAANSAGTDSERTAEVASTSQSQHRDIVIYGDTRVRVFDGGGNMTGPDADGILVHDATDASYQFVAGGVAVSMPVDEGARIEITQQGTEPVSLLATDFGPSVDPTYSVPQQRATFDILQLKVGAIAILSDAGTLSLATLELQVDANGDGSFEQTLVPNALLETPAEAQDVTPPTTLATIAGATSKSGELTGDATITLTAQDNAGGAGLLATWYSLNSGETWLKYGAPIVVAPGAALMFDFYSTDRAGNQESIFATPLNFESNSRALLPIVVNQDGEPKAALQFGVPEAAEYPAKSRVANAPVSPATPAAVEVIYTATTDAGGFYRIENLPNGTYQITPQLTGYVFTPAGTSRSVASNALTGVDFAASLGDSAPMVLIPAGAFQMGCNPDSLLEGETCDDYECEVDEEWVLANCDRLHTVNLSTYYIDKHEVTNAQYESCVKSGNCTPPEYWGLGISFTCPEKPDGRCWTYPYFGTQEYANYPVLEVTWDQANAYCLWAGKRLPTEAEWEKAARGSVDTRSYPWGNSAPTCDLANVTIWHGLQDGGYEICVDEPIGYAGFPTAVGAYPQGASPYGVLDMMGNAYEWVNDWWGEDYYLESPNNNPKGPATGEFKVIRGSGYYVWNDYEVQPLYTRFYYAFNGAGFRCAKSQ